MWLSVMGTFEFPKIKSYFLFPAWTKAEFSFYKGLLVPTTIERSRDLLRPHHNPAADGARQSVDEKN